VCITVEFFTATILAQTWFSVLEPFVKMDTFALPSAHEKSTRIWLSFGWIPLVLMGISIFFNSGITAFVGWLLEIALMSI